MKKILACMAAVAVLAACTNDDHYSWDNNFRDLTDSDTLRIAIAYSGTTVTVTGDSYGYVSADGAHVTVKSASNRFVELSLSGSTDDGSLLIFSWKKLGIVLNGVSITNPQGAAINNQCGKSFYVSTARGTVNNLSDGASYAVKLGLTGDTIDQKATLFSEGQIYFRGEGTLNVSGAAKNGIASDDYVVIESGEMNVSVAATGSNGIKVNDGFTVSGGTLTIDVKADGARGVKNDSYTTIKGGTTTITTSGDCLIETTDGVSDTTSCAGIKCDSLFTMESGSLTITSKGDGGKGINCAQNVEMKGGTLLVTTTGSNHVGKPKAVKSDTGIVLSGGSFTAKAEYTYQSSKGKTKYIWACDNGKDIDEDEDEVEDCVTIVGTPTKKEIVKNSVVVIF